MQPKSPVTTHPVALICEELPEKLLFKGTLSRQIEIATLLEVEGQKPKVQLLKGVITASYLHERNLQGRVEVHQMDEVPNFSKMSPLWKPESRSIKVTSKVTVYPPKFREFRQAVGKRAECFKDQISSYLKKFRKFFRKKINFLSFAL